MLRVHINSESNAVAVERRGYLFTLQNALLLKAVDEWHKGRFDWERRGEEANPLQEVYAQGSPQIRVNALATGGTRSTSSPG